MSASGSGWFWIDWPEQLPSGHMPDGIVARAHYFADGEPLCKQFTTNARSLGRALPKADPEDERCPKCARRLS